MDPNASDSSSQKTSPDQDPAAIAQLSSVLSAQANQLALHQQQLERLTSLTGELVKALQTLTPTPPATAVTPSPVSPPTPQPATVSPRLAFPDKFDGSPSKCKGFLLQCSIFVNQQPALYPTDASKISFVCSLLTGKALDWATAVWGTDGSVFPTFNYFLQRFREVFDHPSGGKNAGEQLLALSQGSSTAAEYALNFRTLAAQTTWVEDTLKLLFRRGLNTDLQTELACRDEGRGLEEFIELAIHIDNLIRSRHMLDRWVIVYIDDILIYSSSLQEHILHVRAVLQRLIKHQLYAKAEKCEFHQMSISFLGYIISHEGVSMDEAKVRAVTEWPQPRTLKELQRFLGFANFYRRFIRGFSLIAAPLTSMTKRSSPHLTWTTAATQAFTDLKSRFTTAPILHHPDPSLPLVVEVDASSTGIGAILSQRNGSPARMFPCAYYSRKLSSAERNYDVGNRELLAMKSAVEEWRHWLEGAQHPFTILTDHKNLEYLRSAKRLNPRQARWALFFTRFNFTVTYRPGTKNTKADSLSRMTESTDQPNTNETIIPENLLVAPVQWDIVTNINLTNEQHPPPPECPPQLTYVPETHREQLLQQVHSTPSSGHPGITATLHLLKNRFWWPTINQDTQAFVKNCTVCNTCKPSRQLPAGLLQPLPIPQRPSSHIAIDFVTDLPNSQGKTTILTVVDRFSKSCRLIPLPKLPTALETAETLCNFVFRFYGLPEDILSDRGPQFTSRVWAAFFSLLNVNISLTSGYHPQANGQTERLNQELTRFLRTYCHSHQADWSRYLMWAEYAQNSLLKPATGLTPFKCVLGYQPPLFPWSGEPSDLPSVNEWLQRSEETWNRAHIHLQRAVRHQVEQANRHRRPNPEYTPGQWVWLSTRDLRLRLPSRKLSPRYVGPFKILRQITPVSFRLELPSNYRISPTFHVSLLKPAEGPGETTEEEEGAEVQTPPPILVDGEEAYQVRDLLDSRRRGGVLQYLVDWEGYGPEERSWVNARDILDPTLKEAFHQAHPEKPAPRPRGRPRRQQPSRFRSRSQGGDSVTNEAPASSLPHHQREPSPEF
ncbi:hypothetical protein M9458_056260 [Cirrhinus mrigala]|uniref:Gypsy retrotransposon integrase-like protein 1 n=1 Tax=Cirrhinus mrigala TaxID=683832 RepID=A0ABD0MFN3_CIRMR